MSVTVKINEEKNGVELRFPAMPAPEILDRLRADPAWRYHRKGKFWYAKQTPAALAFAEALEAGEAVPASRDSASAEKAVRRAQKPAYQFKYLFSGYRDESGDYHKGSWSLCDGFTDGKRAYQIEFSGDTFGDLPIPQGAEFKNDSDSMSDYFERSRWYIGPDCPDFLGCLEAWEKQEEHDRKRFEKLEEKRGVKNGREPRIADKMRLGLNRTDAAASVDRDDAGKRRKEARQYSFVAEARRLAELFRDARESGGEQALENARAQLTASVAAYQAEKRGERMDSQRKTTLSMLETARRRGCCLELDGAAFVLTEAHVRELFSGRQGIEYTLIAADPITGGTLFCGKFDTAEARKAKIVELLRSRNSAAPAEAPSFPETEAANE